VPPQSEGARFNAENFGGLGIVEKCAGCWRRYYCIKFHRGLSNHDATFQSLNVDTLSRSVSTMDLTGKLEAGAGRLFIRQA